MIEEQIANPAWKWRSTCGQHARPVGNEAPRIRHPKFHSFSVSNYLKVNRLSAKIRKNEKSENAERSEPNIGKLPSRANRAFLETSKISPAPENDFSPTNLSRVSLERNRPRWV
jgi:hypothetical protein